MGAWLLPAVTAGISAVSAATTKRRRFDAKAARRINDRFLGMRPGGYLSPEDIAQINQQRARGTASARRSGELGRESAYRQAAARHLSGASAAALLTDAGQAEARGRESAVLGANDLASSLFGQNRDFEREKIMKAWGGELSAAAGDAANSAAEEAGTWNSILGAIPAIADAWGGVPTSTIPSVVPTAAAPGGAGAATYNPSAGLPSNKGPMRPPM